jgi:hypothetical protein
MDGVEASREHCLSDHDRQFLFAKDLLVSQKSLLPVYFPPVEEGTADDLSPGRVERLTLVLAGLDPAILKTMKAVDGVQSRTLEQLRRDSDVRKISPASSLAQDHRYLLSPFYTLSNDAFKELWLESKSVSGGQESTDLIKHVNWLKKVLVTETTGAFVKPVDEEFCSEMPKFAPKVLFYLYRSAVRHIDKKAWELPPPLKEVSTVSRLLGKLGFARPPAAPAIYLPDPILSEAESYLVNGIKLGRVLRIAQKMARRARA